MATEHDWYLAMELSVFAQRLQSLRKARKLTQTRLAEMVDTSPRVYNRWEKGLALPYFDTVVRLAEILQVSLDELAGRKEPTDEFLIRNPKLHALCRQIDRLSDEDQQALLILLDSLVKRSRMGEVMAG